MTDVHAGNLIHIPLIQFKVQDVPIFLHPFPMDGFGNCRDTTLQEPAQGDLCRRFSVLRADLLQPFLVENISLAFRQRPPMPAAEHQTFS